MRLEQYIDLDRELHLEGAAGEVARRLRAEAAVPVADQSDDELLLQWVRQERSPGGLSLGGLARSAFQWAFVLVALLGGVIGAAAAAGLLRYDGSQPINVLLFLAILVGIQILMIPFLLLALLYRRQLSGGLRLMQGLLGGLMRRLIRAEVTRRATGVTPEQLEAEWGRLQASGSLYSRVKPILLLLLVQGFGVAFNLGAVAALSFLVLFSDLAFAWSTTLHVEASRIHQLTGFLSAPWFWFWPEARPSLELVEATRFARFDGAYVGASDAASLLAGGWWRFLAAATVIYGLVPRLLALVAGWMLFRAEMRRALARNSRVQELTERLRTPWVVMGPTEEREEEERWPEPDGARVASVPEAARGDLRLGVVFWAYDRLPDAPALERVLHESIGGEAIFIEEAGNVEKAEAPLLERLRAKVAAGEVDGAAVFFEPFEPPKTDARRFLRAVREAVGESAPVLVLLGEFAEDRVVAAEAEDREIWQKAVGMMGDPFLFLRTVEDK
jgi:hypothetical protein